MNQKCIIELKNAGFYFDDSYDKNWIFKNIKLSVFQSDVTHIKGRNGSGKTTLLKAITGEHSLKRGTITYPNGAIYSVYLDQNADNFTAAHLTLFEQLFACSKTRDRKHFKQSIYVTLKKYDVGLESRLNEFVGHLSGGQRQIAALLSVLLSGANLICLDEFTSAMDQISIEISKELIKEYVENSRIAVIYIDHNQWIEYTTSTMKLGG